ncbi:tyrosine-protein phosphatase [Lacticaseibacillus thailandensis]|uniref:Protein tyrosine serine phosphatase n=1 Tax=Lacticaseibacillus thailandensis DSM 22698 = JCM 13996 TaxID=1423810 RepID=A0A0R2CH51_9LACO|nr:tyrosine-protein phosphatase [Lacticaseibacillus thailandensis]KRM87334.1 protein tyrosine serine phosphatase [Lacticaseibacillus thailandensis DSM 22698 = JCM 13996]
MQPNLLNIHHGFNFRDLGGYTTTDGRRIRSHRLVRSGKLDQLSDRDVHFLGEYGVRHDVDFRSPDEQTKAPDRPLPAAHYHSLPVFITDQTQVSKTWEEEQAEFSQDPRGGFKNMVITYRNLVMQKPAQHAYQEFFRILLTSPDHVTLFHCTAGKDRTGMGAVYLLSALGVDAHTIRADYLAANQFIQTPLDDIMQETRAHGGNANLLQSIHDLWTVHGAFLDSALNTIQSEYGSMDVYLHDVIGLSNSDRRDLQELYLEDAS